MALTYTWSVTSLKVRDEVNADGETLSNSVVQTYWKCTGTDENGNSGTFSGATPFTAANVPAGSFIAFADLAEADVIGWIEAVVNGDANYKAHIDSKIMDQINAAVTTDADLPWGSTAEPAPTPDPEL